jgi:hypothetical protein
MRELSSAKNQLVMQVQWLWCVEEMRNLIKCNSPLQNSYDFCTLQGYGYALLKQTTNIEQTKEDRWWAYYKK